MNNARRFQSTMVAMAFCLTSIAVADEAELPSGATVLDPGLMMYSWPHPLISPDGQWVAYISKGFVCVCNVAAPAPRRLFEVPNTWTHFLAQPEQAHAKGIFHETIHGLNRDEYRAVLAKISSTVHGLRWTYDGDGVVFGVQSRGEDSKKSTSDIWHVSVDGTVTNLSHTDQDTRTSRIVDAILTRDRKFLVSPRHKRPLIWIVATNKPRPTCFLNLTPSSTSGRWIGVEKDTRQLVIVNEEFDIVKRFDVTQPARYGGLKLNWSPDERFIIWRNQIGFDHFSNWEGFWMDIKTGKKRELSGRYMNEQFAFTGRGGEFIRWGATGMKTHGYDRSIGAHLTVISDKDEPAKDIWRIEQPYTTISGYPPVRLGPECAMFAIGSPRPSTSQSGFSWLLSDREGKTWRFPGDDNGNFIPFEVVGFAEGGKTIVAYDSTRLFAIPVATIMDVTH